MKTYIIAHVSTWDYELDINLIGFTSLKEAKLTLNKMFEEELKLFLEKWNIEDIEIDEHDNIFDISYTGYGSQYSSHVEIQCI